MSVYTHYLPSAFPIGVTVDRELAERCVAVLMEPFMGGEGGQELENGSSFAHTADAPGWGARRLWLSRASLDRLHDAKLLLDVKAPDPQMYID